MLICKSLRGGFSRINRAQAEKVLKSSFFPKTGYMLLKMILVWSVSWFTLQFSHNCVRLFAAHGLQHARLPCPSWTLRACSNSCPLSWWCHPTISSSVIPFLPSIFPSIRVFSNESVLYIRWPKYWSFSISPSDEYTVLISFRMDWFDLLQSKGFSTTFSRTTVQKHQFFGTQLSLWSTLISIHDYWKNHSFD